MHQTHLLKLFVSISKQKLFVVIGNVGDRLREMNNAQKEATVFFGDAFAAIFQFIIATTKLFPLSKREPHACFCCVVKCLQLLHTVLLKWCDLFGVTPMADLTLAHHLTTFLELMFYLINTDG